MPRPHLVPWRLSDVLIVVTVVAALMIVSFLGGRAFCAAVLAADADPLDCIAEPLCEGWDVALVKT